jgi:tetratricopeptide (TPR) repeat protein
MTVGAPSLSGGFLSGDDIHLVLNHVLVNHPSIRHAFELVTIVHRDLYQPVALLSFSLDFVTIGLLGLTPAADGPAAGAWVFHLTNVLVHALNGVLVFWLFTRLADRRAVAVVAAVLFALHPFAAEVVAWLNGRMMLLSTLFSLASLIALDVYLVRRKWSVAILVQVFVVLAMASKVRVGLPVLMLLLPLARWHRPRRHWWMAWAGAAVLTAGFTVFNVVTTAHSEMFEGAAEQLEGSRIARTVLVLSWYFQHYLVPVGMSPWHPPEALVLWSHAQIPVALVTLLLVGAAAALSWRWTRVGVLGLVWFMATVASTLPLVPARDVMAADRYVYLPNVGLHWIAGALLVQVVLWARRRIGHAAIPYVGAGLGVIAAALLLPYTWRVESYYLSNLAKASRIAEVYPDEPGVWEAIGWAYYRQGDYCQAIEEAREDLDRHPEKMACEVHQLIGMAQVRMGQVPEGIQVLHRAAEADPEYGKCYARLGQVYYEIEQYGDAETNLRRAIELMPDYLPSIQVLGHLYRKTGRLDDAAGQYERGLEINDFDPVSTTALAEIDMTRGDYASAIVRFERLLSWMPENIVARTNLGVCYAQTGRTAAAMEAYAQALQRDPGAVTAALNLAALRAEVGDRRGAIDLLEQACSLRPGDRDVLVAGHDLLMRLDAQAAAAALWSEALRRDPQAADLTAWYAWTSAVAGKWAPARTAAGRALQLDPSQSLALAALVLAELAANSPEAADQHLDQLLDAPPTPPDARARFRNAVAEIGMGKPQDPWPYYVAARLLLADGQRAAARQTLDEFLRLCTDPAWRQRARQMLPPD